MLSLGCVAEIAAVIEALAIVCGVWIAYKGLTAWRPQIRGQTEYEVARKIMLAAHRFRGALLGLRGPFMGGGEMVAALMAEGHSREEARKKAQESHDEAFAMAYQVRWKDVGQVRAEFDTAVVEGVVHWGQDVNTAAKQLRQCESDLFVAVSAVLRDKGRSERGREPTEREIERLRAHEPLMFGGDGWPDDAFAKRVDAAIGALDALVRPYLK